MQVKLTFSSMSDLYKMLKEPYLVKAINKGYLGDLAYMLSRQIPKTFLTQFQTETDHPFDFDLYSELLCAGFDGEFFAIQDSHLMVTPIINSIHSPFEVDSRIEFIKAFLTWYVEKEKIDIFSE